MGVGANFSSLSLVQDFIRDQRVAAERPRAFEIQSRTGGEGALQLLAFRQPLQAALAFEELFDDAFFDFGLGVGLGHLPRCA